MLNPEQHIFVKNRIGDYESAVTLAGDASVRSYYRICSGERSFILCNDAQYKNYTDEVFPFLIVYNLFKKEAVPVPDILFRDNSLGLFLLQDAGDDSLEMVYKKLNREDVLPVYRETIDILVKIQRIRRVDNIPPFQLSFDVDKLMYEFEFFIEHALKSYFRARLSGKDIKRLKNLFREIAELLYVPEKFVLNHRDFHSRNVLIFKNSPVIIDFQDARLGLPQYDAVSFLRDSYVVLDEQSFGDLLKYYYRASSDSGIHNMGYDEFSYYFDLSGFQRNIKAIGTFAYQSKVKGKVLYEEYIKPSLEYVRDYVERRDELKKAGELLFKLIEVEI